MKQAPAIIPILLLLLSISIPATAQRHMTFITQNFPPFSYFENSTVKGPGADLINVICKKMNTECKLIVRPWRRANVLMEKGQVQSFFFIGKNEEREKSIIFSPPIISTEYGFFECTTAPLNYSSIESLRGKYIGAFGPSNTSYQLKKISSQLNDEMHLDLSPDTETLLRRLEKNRLDGVYSNKHVGFAFLKRLKIKNIRYVGDNQKVDYYFGFSNKSTPEYFIKIFNSHIIQMKESGELEDILDRYDLKMAQ